MRKWLRRGAIGFCFAVALLAIAAGGGYLWLRGSLPQTAGQATAPGLGESVTILRDADGLVTIRAQSDADAYYGLGYAHAQDRLFQMDLMRRLGAGRLSEVVGSATLNTDKLMRIFGFYRLAEANVAILPADMRAALDAYTAGVNAFLTTHSGALPPEFYLLRYRPEPWRPADSLVWGRLMAMQLSGNWWEELLRYRLSHRLTPAQLEALWPAVPPDTGDGQQATTPEDRALLAPPKGQVGAMPDSPVFERPLGASNSFAVNGSLSATGKPLLANDPHLGLQAPIQWYLARLETPTLRLAGATAPGVPLMIIGHNGRVAWSFTTTQGDTQDLFLEKLAPGDTTRYLVPGASQIFITHEETIKVRGEPDVTLTVRESRHGPIVSDAPSVEWPETDQALALAWPALNSDDGTAAALWRMNHAKTATELRQALENFDSPQQNVVFADVDGHIGFVAAGRVPIRKQLSASGQMPAPGWSGDYDWTGYLAFSELPQRFDPPTGWIATANNRLLDPGYPHFIAAHWEPPFRYRRIADLIQRTPKHTEGTMAAIQTDTLSLAAEDLLPRLLDQLDGTATGGEADKAALALLRGWDFRVTRDEPQPLIFTTWLAALARSLLGDELGDLFPDYASWNLPQIGAMIAHGQSAWCDDASTPAIEDCRSRVDAAWHATMQELTTAYGPDPARWRWGDAHRAAFPNLVWSRVPLLGALLRQAVETDGDNFTVNRGTPRMDFQSAVFPDVHGPGLRAIFDLADLDRSRFIIAGGQSGNPLSPHYTDQIERWRDGGYVELGGQGDSVLTLVPAAR
jgi:penicillin amidase